MKKTIIMPRMYIQGNGVLSEIGDYILKLGKRPVIIWDQIVRNILSNNLLNSIKNANCNLIETSFNGECTKKEAKRIADIVLKENSDVVVGIGGGKTLDVSKAVAAYTGNPNIVVPSCAASDAATSSYTAWYDEEGHRIGNEKWNFNPDIVLADTGILVKAPVRLFIAGIGDALATWYETNACFTAGIKNYANGYQTLTVLNMAKLCLDTLIEYGKLAKISVEKQVVTSAFEKVVEAIILLSGIGWESGGIATAHSLGTRLGVVFPETDKFLHGECVSFGLICQLCLEENLRIDEIYKIVDFMIEIGLPVTFNDLNLNGLNSNKILKLAESTLTNNLGVNHHNFEVTVESLANAITLADSLGNFRKQNMK